MTFLSDHSRVNTVILILIASAWLYTEIVEHIKRDAFKQEIVEFIERIDHDMLLKRVEKLEQERE